MTRSFSARPRRGQRPWGPARLLTAQGPGWPGSSRPGASCPRPGTRVPVPLRAAGSGEGRPCGAGWDLPYVGTTLVLPVSQGTRGSPREGTHLPASQRAAAVSPAVSASSPASTLLPPPAQTLPKTLWPRDWLPPGHPHLRQGAASQNSAVPSQGWCQAATPNPRAGPQRGDSTAPVASGVPGPHTFQSVGADPQGAPQGALTVAMGPRAQRTGTRECPDCAHGVSGMPESVCLPSILVVTVDPGGRKQDFHPRPWLRHLLGPRPVTSEPLFSKLTRALDSSVRPSAALSALVPDPPLVSLPWVEVGFRRMPPLGTA